MKLHVEGMTCGHCERSVQQAIAGLGGRAHVDLRAGTVDVTGVDDPEAARAAIRKAGYTVADGPARGGAGGCCSSTIGKATGRLRP